MGLFYEKNQRNAWFSKQFCLYLFKQTKSLENMKAILKALARARLHETDKQIKGLAQISQRERLMYELASEQEQEWWHSLTNEQQHNYINQAIG